MKRKGLFQFCVTLIAVCVLLFTSFATPPAGLSQSGFMVMGIVVAAMLLWLLVNLEWTSLFIIFALCLIPELGLKTVSANSFGSTTVIFFITMFILASTLITTGVAKRIAIMLVTSRASRKSPWMTTLMIFAGAFLLGQVLAAPTVLVIYYPILYEIFAMAEFKQGDKAPAMLLLGATIVTQSVMGMTPICHAVAITGVANFAAYTGQELTIAQFLGIGLPVGIIMFFAIFLICKYIWKPDLSNLEKIDFDTIKSQVGPMTSEEKLAIGTYLIVILLWVLPGLTDIIPAFKMFKGVQNVYPPIVAISLLCVIRVNGKPILNYTKALKDNVPWRIIIFAAAIQALGSALSNKDIGFSAWAGEALAPAFANISPTVFFMILIALTVILTNFISNSVTLALMMAVGLPLVSTVYSGQINPMTMAVLLIGGANYAFATPPATHAIALASNTGWIDVKTIAKYGAIISVAGILIYYVIGIPLGNMLYGV